MPWGWADSERKLREAATRRRVKISAVEYTIGLWSTPEPSLCSELLGGKENVKQLARDVRRLYGQDAVALLVPRRGGEGGMLTWDFGKVLSDIELNKILDGIRLQTLYIEKKSRFERRWKNPLYWRK